MNCISIDPDLFVTSKEREDCNTLCEKLLNSYNVFILQSDIQEDIFLENATSDISEIKSSGSNVKPQILNVSCSGILCIRPDSDDSLCSQCRILWNKFFVVIPDILEYSVISVL